MKKGTNEPEWRRVAFIVFFNHCYIQHDAFKVFWHARKELNTRARTKKLVEKWKLWINCRIKSYMENIEEFAKSFESCSIKRILKNISFSKNSQTNKKLHSPSAIQLSHSKIWCDLLLKLTRARFCSETEAFKSQWWLINSHSYITFYHRRS